MVLGCADDRVSRTGLRLPIRTLLMKSKRAFSSEPRSTTSNKGGRRGPPQQSFAINARDPLFASNVIPELSAIRSQIVHSISRVFGAA